MVLSFHDWKELKSTDEQEIIALFLFSLAPEDGRGEPGPRETFWTEVQLSRDLARRGSWPRLSRREKLKAMLRFAQERVIEVGRKLRQAPMFWTAQSRLEDGPPWDLSAVPFPKPSAVTFEPPTAAGSRHGEARRAAGLKSLGE
jgi:hypothetical protein